MNFSIQVSSSLPCTFRGEEVRYNKDSFPYNNGVSSQGAALVIRDLGQEVECVLNARA